MSSRRNRLTKRAVVALSRPPDSLFLTARRKSRIWPSKRIVSRDRLTILLNSCGLQGTSMTRAIIGALVLFLGSTSASAQTSWPESVKRSYVERCAESISSQGLPPKIAKAYCSCIADGMSKEFGKEEYNQMMKAEPDPKGTPYDQRLYKVFSACSSILPR